MTAMIRAALALEEPLVAVVAAEEAVITRAGVAEEEVKEEDTQEARDTITKARDTTTTYRLQHITN